VALSRPPVRSSLNRPSAAVVQVLIARSTKGSASAGALSGSIHTRMTWPGGHRGGRTLGVCVGESKTTNVVTIRSTGTVTWTLAGPSGPGYSPGNVRKRKNYFAASTTIPDFRRPPERRLCLRIFVSTSLTSTARPDLTAVGTGWEL
jgi:hypothetical protein